MGVDEAGLWKGTPEQFVYLIGGGEERRGRRRCKIGVAADPGRRLRELQTASPDRLELLGIGPGGLALEAHLHARYRRHRLHGEWFSLGKVERAEILRMLAARTAEAERAVNGPRRKRRRQRERRDISPERAAAAAAFERERKERNAAALAEGKERRRQAIAQLATAWAEFRGRGAR